MLDLALVCIFGISIFILAALTYGRSAPSGRVVITRPSAKSVDGFGGVRGHDYSYSPTIRGAMPPFPVGLRRTRVPTRTFHGSGKG